MVNNFLTLKCGATVDIPPRLCPHESAETDVILLGHSMGGILAAEVVLLPPYSPSSNDTFRHHILGTINFDTPFLGMHPGVVVSGLSSLFKPKPASPELRPQNHNPNGTALLPMPRSNGTPDGSLSDGTVLHPSESQDSAGSGYFPAQRLSTSTTGEQGSTQQSLSPLALPVNDPNFNPPFPNDVRIPMRKGWDNAIHFITKHSDGLTKATKSYVTSHFEFGGAMADYVGLKARYGKIRALEDVNESGERPPNAHRPPRRVRFVNYYTASTGYIHPSKRPPTQQKMASIASTNLAAPTVEQGAEGGKLSAPSSIRSSSVSPRISIEDPQGNVSEHDPLEETESSADAWAKSSESSQEMSHMEPDPLSDTETTRTNTTHTERPSLSSSQTPATPCTTSSTNFPSERSPSPKPTTPRTTPPPPASQTSSLPPLPPIPTTPPAFDPSPYPDKDTLKLASKAHARAQKAYERAVHDREKALRDRQKLLEKREKNARLAREKEVKQGERVRLKKERKDAMAEQKVGGDEARGRPMAGERAGNAGSERRLLVEGEREERREGKPKKDRKFCMLPPKNDKGERDPCWERVFMEGVDEVGAHCGLFVTGRPHYEALVGHVGERIRGWVEEGRR